MKRLILIATILLASQQSAITAGPVARWLGTEHNFGAFDEDLGVVKCRFGVVNDGDAPLVIVGARANCGCTRPEFDSAPIVPGDTAWVSVGYDPKGRPGRFKKYVAVNTNASTERTQLTITASVIGNSNTLRSRFPVDAGKMKLRSTVIPFGQIYKGHTKGAYLEGYNHSSDTIHPLISALPSHLSMTIEPKSVPPGEQFIISGVAHTGKTPKWGIITDRFSISPNPGEKGTDIETVMILREDFSKLTPEQLDKAPSIKTDTDKIDLGRISPTDKGVITRKFVITNTGDNPLLIRDISTPDKALSLKVSSDKLKKGKSATVTVIIDPSKVTNPELLNARITIISNDPACDSKIVRVVAQIKK